MTKTKSLELTEKEAIALSAAIHRQRGSDDIEIRLDPKSPQRENKIERVASLDDVAKKIYRAFPEVL